MPNLSKAIHHLSVRKRIHKKHEPYPSPQAHKRFIDRLIYVAAILGPAANLPQLIKIWYHQNADGVSFISWISFSILSAVWLSYGLAHREKPIIISSGITLLIQVPIALGALVYI